VHYFAGNRSARRRLACKLARFHALVERERDTALPYARARAQIRTRIEVRIAAVGPRFERRHESAEAAAVAHDDELAVIRLPQVMRVDRRGRREELIVGAAHQHLARDAA